MTLGARSAQSAPLAATARLFGVLEGAQHSDAGPDIALVRLLAGFDGSDAATVRVLETLLADANPD